MLFALLLLSSPAAAVERSDFAHGLSVEGSVGGIGFLTVADDIAAPGPVFGLDLGYDLFTWMSLRVGYEGATHETDAPPPPPRTTFQVHYAHAALRVLVPLSLRFSILAEGQGGMAFFSPDILATYQYATYDLGAADEITPWFGATAGIDVHSWGRRLAWGLRAGYRHLPDVGDGAVHGALYLRHTF